MAASGTHPILKYIILIIYKNVKIICRVVEWSALQTSKRGDPSSNPTDVKTFKTKLIS